MKSSARAGRIVHMYVINKTISKFFDNVTDSSPSTDNLPRVDPPVGPPPQGTKPRDNYDFSDLKKDDASFFSKLFGPRR